MTVLMGLDVRLRMARLFLITDLREQTDDFAQFIDDAFSGGVDVVMLRQHGMSSEAALTALETARTIAYHYQGLVVVDGDQNLAKQFSADVLQLGAGAEPAKLARSFLHQWGLIGRAVPDRDAVKSALDDPEINYLTVGPVFASEMTPGGGSSRVERGTAVAGLDLVQDAAKLADPGDPDAKPWFAVGGITADNVDDVLAAGARRIAVESAITRAPDAGAAAAFLADKLRTVWNEDPGMQAYLKAVFKEGQQADHFVPIEEKQSGGGNQPLRITEDDGPR